MYSQKLYYKISGKDNNIFFCHFDCQSQYITENDTLFYLTMSLGTNRFILSTIVKASKNSVTVYRS